MRYRIIGDDSAPNYFSVNEKNGEVKLSAKVAEDTEVLYQVSTVCVHKIRCVRCGLCLTRHEE